MSYQLKRKKLLLWCEECNKMTPHNESVDETHCDDCGEEKLFTPRPKPKRR